MVQFKYNDIMKRYDVSVPFTLADESDMVVVASITEDKEARVVLHRDLSLKLLKQIILHWDGRRVIPLSRQVSISIT